MTTTDSIRPSWEGIGVTLISVRTRRPSGTCRTTSSARTVSALRSNRPRGSSSRATSRPSARRQVVTSSSSSSERPGWRRPSTIRFASRLMDTGRPVRASKTTTPTGEVSIRASRSGPRPLLVPVRAGVGDGGGRLRGEQQQDFFVFLREIPSPLLVAEEEVADCPPPDAASAYPERFQAAAVWEEKPRERT